MGDPPQAGQSPIEPAEGALQGVEQAVSQGREQLEAARDASLAHARSDAERAQINARFDEVNAQFGEFTDRIVGAIENGNQAVLGQLTAIASGINGSQASGQGDTDDDSDFGDIIGIEEIVDGITDGVGGAAEAGAAAVGMAADAAVEQADKAPARAHRMYRKLWGKG